MIGHLIWQFIKWHKIVCNALVARFLDRPAPEPSALEAKLAAALRDEVRLANPDQRPADGATLPKWITFLGQVRSDLINGEARRFLRLPIINHTMCVTNSPSVLREFLSLRLSRQWSSRFRAAVEESPSGHPTPFIYHPRSSGNLLHHCYHILRLEGATGVNIAEVEVIVEFGGGYGSLCRLVHKLGFKGRYFIYDFPEFSALQRYFLSSLLLPVCTDEAADSQPGIHLFSELDRLRKALAACADKHPRAFFATWSLSESPLDLRERFLPLVVDSDVFLFAFQDTFEAIDNNEYFGRLAGDTGDRILWTKKKLRHIPGNNYLFGKRVCAKN